MTTTTPKKTTALPYFSSTCIVTAFFFLPLVSATAAQIQTLADTGTPGYSGGGGPASEAQLKNPFGVVKGPDGSLYICDTFNHCIRRVTPDGIISTVAGNGEAGYDGDGGPATAARLNQPYEIRLDRADNLVFVEMVNNVIRRVGGAEGGADLSLFHTEDGPTGGPNGAFELAVGMFEA